ncbi:MAG: Transcriptional regulator, TetR family [Labilithrix sp.]|nr:Transcriptional regulator, TetR family [Labilithrix sp.]
MRDDSSSRRTIGARTGGRSKRVVNDVLRATVEEIARCGYTALRVEDVAARAGVNKTTVYRRWPTKCELAGAAMRAFAGQHQPLPDTGSLRDDLLEMVRRAMAYAATAEGQAFTRLLTVESTEPDVDSLARSLRTGMASQRAEIIVRAQRRGELPDSIDPRIIVDAIFIPITTRLLRFREEVDAATAEAFVDLALGGAMNAAARAHQEAC